jgi:DNA-binding NtrC family response regulator
MSLIEEARAVRERVSARLLELEPMVREYEELKQLAAELGIEAEGAAEPASAPPAPAPKRSQRSRSKAREEAVEPPASKGQAAGAELGDQVLEAVRANPGQTVADYARALGVAPTALYRPVRELTTAGAIVKRARQLYLS